MKSTVLARLPIRNAPLVVGVVTSLSTLENLLEAPPQARCYDAVELRLDFLSDKEQWSNNWIDTCRKLEEGGIPVVLTIRLQKEGGRWEQDDWARKPLFARALGRVSAVDIELTSPLLLRLGRMISAGSTSLIGSYHNFVRTPALYDLRLLISDARKAGVDLVKIVTTINSGGDTDTLVGVLEKERPYPLCIIGMGDKGVDTRFTFPEIGSLLTYGYIDQPTAPGQSSCEELDARLRARLPAYRARREWQ